MINAMGHRRNGQNPKAKIDAFANNQYQLGEILGVSRQLIAYHLKRKNTPGTRPDGRYDIAAWREYLAANSTAATGPEAEGFFAARARREALAADKAQFQLEVLKKNFIPKAVIKRVNSQFIQAAKTRSLAGVSRLATLARLAPDLTAAAEVIRREMLDIWREMSRSEWYQPEHQGTPAQATTTQPSIAEGI